MDGIGTTVTAQGSDAGVFIAAPGGITVSGSAVVTADASQDSFFGNEGSARIGLCGGGIDTAGSTPTFACTPSGSGGILLNAATLSALGGI
ncbi:MAG: hypothetical protein HYV99_06775, partial [Betaproteobacteria bacterium]|nr:hypothetical protein [Betaproteobacteria bacterium]